MEEESKDKRTLTEITDALSSGVFAQEEWDKIVDKFNSITIGYRVPIEVIKQQMEKEKEESEGSWN